MAQQPTCDAADGEVAAYLITDLSNGDTAAWCIDHWVDQCAQVTRAVEEVIAGSAPAPVEPQPIDPVAPDVEIPPVDPVEDQAEHQADDEDEDGSEECPWCGERLPGYAQEAHALNEHPAELAALVAGQEGRVRAELGARPDSAATSEAVTWTPGGEDA